MMQRLALAKVDLHGEAGEHPTLVLEVRGFGLSNLGLFVGRQARAVDAHHLARTPTCIADRRACGLRLFVDEAYSKARDDRRQGRDAEHKTGGPPCRADGGSYSRSACAGSVRVARQAGKRQAAKEAVVITTEKMVPGNIFSPQPLSKLR